MDLFKEKYKNIFRDLYDEDNQDNQDNVKEPFQSDEDNTASAGERGVLEGDESQVYVTIMIYAAIILFCSFAIYKINPQHRLVAAGIFGTAFILVPLLTTTIVYFIKSPAGQMPGAKVFFGIALFEEPKR